MFFEILSKDKQTKARLGKITTAHGAVATPVFMPVGTNATIKALDSDDIKMLGAEIVLANAYHLNLRPGDELVAKMGGLNKFADWSCATLTDSGGFQVFSLGKSRQNFVSQNLDGQTKEDGGKPPHLRDRCGGKLVEVDDEGVTFRSHLDGSLHRMTAEDSIRIQNNIGADIIMAFDQCTEDTGDKEAVRVAMERTHSWAKRSLDYFKKTNGPHAWPQYLFGIIQGSTFPDLRQASAKFISSLDFDGVAIGGETTGFNMAKTKEVLEWVVPLIPENKPRYTMGVGFSPLDFFDVVEAGVDMFDCVSPTRMARNGSLFNRHEPNFRLNIEAARCREDAAPIEVDCQCLTCKNYSRAYLHHLFHAKELSAYRLATIHNLHFMLGVMSDIRAAIKEGRFLELKSKWVSYPS